MATVPFQDRLALTHPLTGITVGVYPSSDPFYDIQIYRAASTKSGAGPTSVPASSKFSELATLGVINGQASVTYRDSLPLSNTLWWYKARSVKTNVATPSAFTTAVYSQAGLMPTSAPGAIPWTGKPIQVTPRLSTNATPAYGTTAAPAYISKTRRILPTEFRPEDDRVTYTVQGGWLSPRTTAVSAYDADLLLPIGSIITGALWSLHRESTKGTAKVELWYGNAAGFGSTQVINKTSTGVGDYNYSQSGLNLAFTTGHWLFTRVTLTATGTAEPRTRLLYCDITYNINTLAQSI